MTKLSPDEVGRLNQQFEAAPAESILAWAAERFGMRAAIGTSFQGAGLVIMHLARTLGLRFPIFTIDTGLLFAETAVLRERLERFLGCQIETLVPDLTVAQQASVNGPELWKRDPDLCCTLRKVLPLQARLGQLDCWITGLRRQQSDTRSTMGILGVYLFDESTGREVVKLNPLANWSRDAVWAYLHKHQVPYHPLQDQGYRSIGCWPCTARTGAGENERAGRWVGFRKTECGIHTFLAKKA